MATEPACANEAFNVTNTDLYRRHALCLRPADAFDMPFGSVRPLRLAEVMAGRERNRLRSRTRNARRRAARVMTTMPLG